MFNVFINVGYILRFTYDRTSIGKIRIFINVIKCFLQKTKRVCIRCIEDE